MTWLTGAGIGGLGGGGGGGGFGNPATEDLDMGGNDIVAPGNSLDISAGGAVTLSSNGSTVTINSDGAMTIVAPSIVLSGDLDMDGNAILASGGATFGDTLDMGGNPITNSISQVLAVTDGVGAPLELTTAQSGRLVTNTGTTVKAAAKLPATAPVGTYYDFLCDDSDGLRVVANTGQTITCGSLGATATAGYVETVRQESAFRVTCTVANTTWRCTRIEGTWRKDSTTSAGFAFTPTAPTAWTPTSATWLANVEFTGLYVHHGWAITSQIQVLVKGTPTTASLTVNNWAGGFQPSATKNLGNRSTGDYLIPLFLGVGMDASAGVVRQIAAAWSHGDDTIYFFCPFDSAATGVTQAAPWTWAGDAGDPEDDDHAAVTGTYYVD